VYRKVKDITGNFKTKSLENLKDSEGRIRVDKQTKINTSLKAFSFPTFALKSPASNPISHVKTY